MTQYRQECREAVMKFARTKPVDEAVWKRIEIVDLLPPG